MIDFIDKTNEQNGTPINRKNLMAVQGFYDKRIEIHGNKIIETNSDGHILTTEIMNDGSIKETFVGEKTIIKTTIKNNDGSITEVLS